MATPPARRPLANAANTPTRTSMNSPRPLNSASPSSGQGLARNPSLRGRAVRRGPNRSISGLEEENDENESKNVSSQLITDLKEQVERAEHASEQYRKQLDALQQRLDEATDQQTVAEEHDFAAKTKIDQLLAEVKDSTRQKRELEMTFDSERSMLLQERERSSLKEAELQSVVNRLTESLKTKNLEKRASMTRSEEFPTDEIDTPIQRSAKHEEYLQALQEREATIDTLKLEMADIHIKVAEQEHMGDGRLQMLERQLSDIKMQNARLVEENDSFQMLLGEKTLKGDFLHDTHADNAGISSLADELDSIGENDEISVEQYKKVETDLRIVREEKKALTLYIDKIIGRLLQHEGFEHIITGKDVDEDVDSPPPPPKHMPIEKPLPSAPMFVAPEPAQETVMGGFLSRAKSVVSRGAPGRPARPMSFMQPLQSANENPQTAPSIPINKGHRRARSDQLNPPDLGAAAVVQQMNKGSPLRTASGSPMSPGISPLARAQTSYFAPPARSDTIRAPSGGEPSELDSSANSTTSGESHGRQSTDATSFPASAQASLHTRDPHRESMGPPVTAGLMKQSQLRPLRLVQNRDAEEESRKRANRQSWMGNWFSKSGVDGQ